MPDNVRAQRKLLKAVADLHLRGYQRLRIIPFIGGPGAWRCTLADAGRVSAAHGARLAPGESEGLARYSSASDRCYWEWDAEPHCSPTRLAEVFLERFPALAKESYGPDWLYAGWFQHMLHVTHPDDLPISYGEWIATGGAMTTVKGVRFHLPPPGHARDSERAFTLPDP